MSPVCEAWTTVGAKLTPFDADMTSADRATLVPVVEAAAGAGAASLAAASAGAVPDGGLAGRALALGEAIAAGGLALGRTTSIFPSAPRRTGRIGPPPEGNC